jgi:hypothetical protein
MERKRMETAILTEVLPIELTNGNDGRGGKWFKTAKVRKKLESPNLASKAGPQPVRFRVRIRLTSVLRAIQRLWGANSIGRGNSKELIDALVVCGWFTDDSPKYVKGCDFRQDDTMRELGPAILFESLSHGDIFTRNVRAGPNWPDAQGELSERKLLRTIARPGHPYVSPGHRPGICWATQTKP